MVLYDGALAALLLPNHVCYVPSVGKAAPHTLQLWYWWAKYMLRVTAVRICASYTRAITWAMSCALLAQRQILRHMSRLLS